MVFHPHARVDPMRVPADIYAAQHLSVAIEIERGAILLAAFDNPLADECRWNFRPNDVLKKDKS